MSLPVGLKPVNSLHLDHQKQIGFVSFLHTMDQLFQMLHTSFCRCIRKSCYIVRFQSIEAYKTESADCEKCQEQIKIQNRQNYEKYHEGQMNQNQFMEAKKQLEEERERLQKRVQELDELINDEKEILMKKNVPVEQMLKYLGYENLTREMLEEYVQGIYVYDDGRVEVEYK